MRITNLKINGVKNPIGYYMAGVTLSWNVSDTASAYAKEKLVRVSKTADFSSVIFQMSGEEVESSGTVIDMELEPYTRYYCSVYVMGNDGDEVEETTWFETGKMQEEWLASWITTQDSDQFHPVFTKKFEVTNKVKAVRLYICGLGCYEAYLNGNPISEDFLAPGMHDYSKEYQYQTYDLTEQILMKNEISVMLGKGWYMGRFGLEGRNCLFGSKMCLIGEIHIAYENGETEVIVTDETWTYRGSDIADSSIYDGEIYDRTLWEKIDNSLKKAVIYGNISKEKLIERFGVSMKVKAEFPVKELIRTPANELVLDFGQNMSGYVEFEADFPRGTQIIIDYGEILQDGNFYNENYRSAKAQFIYVSDGSKEIVRPHFTYYGFRYVRVTGWPEPCNPNVFAAKAVYSDLDRTGYFECSNSKVNRLYQNTFWGQCSNFMDIPTDCPQRDERMAWTGDTSVFSPTACYHMDTRAFYRKFLHDLRNEQMKLNGGIPNYFPDQGNLTGCCAVWGDCGTFLPDTLRRYYQNKADYVESYAMMRDWVNYISRECTDDNFLIKKQHQFGDWLALDGVTSQSMRGGTDEEYIASIYYYASALKTAEMGKELKAQDWKEYENLAEKIKASILKEYFSESGNLCVNTQTGYLLALRFGVYKNKNKIIESFRKKLRLDGYQIKGGFVGAPILCQVLAENGLIEYAYEFLLKEDFPSWLHCVNLGATTIWERWNSVEADGHISGTGMNSLNHYTYGNVAEFLYAYAAGIRVGKDGFKRALIAPEISGRLSYVNGRYESVYGTYVCNWKIEQNGQIKVHIEVPFERQAVVVLPEREAELLSAGKYDYEYYPKKDLRYIWNENSMLGELVKIPEAVRILSEYVPQGLWLGNGDLEGRTVRLKELKEMFYMGVEPHRCQMAIDEIAKLKV